MSGPGPRPSSPRNRSVRRVRRPGCSERAWAAGNVASVAVRKTRPPGMRLARAGSDLGNDRQSQVGCVPPQGQEGTILFAFLPVSERLFRWPALDQNRPGERSPFEGCTSAGQQDAASRQELFTGLTLVSLELLFVLYGDNFDHHQNPVRHADPQLLPGKIIDMQGG